MDNYIQSLHHTLLEILVYVAEFCDSNHLQYCLIFGTALGAYRHSGFIPWDDDVDIAMPREDYEKFIRLMEKENGMYEIQYEKNEENYFLAFAKVRKKGTLFIESITEGLYKNNGIFIDVFPLDNVGDPDRFDVKFKKKQINYLMHCLKLRSCPDLYRKLYSRPKYILHRIFTLPGCLLSNRSALHRIRQLSVNPDQNTAYVALYSASVAVIMKREVYFPCREILFEGKALKVPHEIETYLTNVYGKDYMQLPPVEKRQTHLPVKVEF